MTTESKDPTAAREGLRPPVAAPIEDPAKQRRHREWKLANRENIAAYNALVEREGVFSDGLRLF